MLKQVESPLESPESLLAALDSEILTSRSRRELTHGHRTAVLAGGLLLILGGMTVALCALFSSISGLPRGGPDGASRTALVSQP